ncbi:MAG: glycosyltransferase [Verrucomicrobiaceae bacterium]|nr:glycosyltransferase [Verrucomicrobiaceae bacterium]
MAAALRARGVQVDVATTDDDGPGRRTDQVLGATVVFPKQIEFYKFSFPMLRWLWRNVKSYDVVHIHALFSFSSTAAAWAARWRRIPYVLRPLGVLNHYGMKQRRPLLKRLSSWLLEGPILKHAAAMHYTSRAEQIEAEANGALAEGAVIPLGVPAPSQEVDVDVRSLFLRFPEIESRERILFLSRLDAKKGLDCLIEAMKIVQLKHPRAMLLIAGKGDPSYEDQMRALAQGMSVSWLGHVDGALKEAIFQTAHLFVLPSHSENFGIAAVEAMMRGVPSILSSGVAVADELASAGACVKCSLDATEIAEKICMMLADDGARASLGEAGRKAVEERFSVNTMGASLDELYRRISFQS